MELIGLKDGKEVRTDIADFAKDNAMEGEEYAGFGQSATHARYSRRDGSGKVNYREVDLRELAAQGGVTGVQFKFDAAKARAQNRLLEDRVDSGVAYNLERLRSDEGKRAYLASKGHTGIFNDGDNFYSIKDGYIQAINNKDGEFDWSDVSRFGASAGKEIGSVAGVALSGIGAAAIGPASLLMAGAAGATGAMIGEGAQRAVDTGLEIIGAKEDTSKYQNATAAEEALSMAKTAGGGALTAAGGQLASRAIGAVATAGAKGIAGMVQKVGSEEAAAWTAKKAAQQETGYLMSQLPLKGATKNEAIAQRLLKDTQNPEATTAMIQKANSEAKTIISGRSKNVIQDATQDAEQESLRTVARGAAVQKEAAEADTKASQKWFDETREQRKAQFYEDSIARAEDTFGTTHSKELEKVFSPLTSDVEAEVASKKIQQDFLGKLKQRTGVSLQIGPEGRIAIAKDELESYTTKRIQQGLNEAGEFADSMSLEGLKFNAIPKDQDKAALVEAVQNCKSQMRHIQGLDESQYKNAMPILEMVEKAINNHTPMTQEDTAAYLIKFMAKSREIAGSKEVLPAVQNAIKNLNQQMFKYTRDISNAPLLLDKAQAAQMKALELSQISREGFTGVTKDPTLLFKHLDDLGRVGGDETGALGSEVASMWHLYFKEEGNDGMRRATYGMMNDVDKVRFSGFDAVRQHNILVPKKPAPKVEAEEGVMAKALPVAAGIATMGVTGSPMLAGAASAATAAVVSKKVRGKVAEKSASSLKNVGKVLASRPGKIAVGQRVATGAEEYVADKLQNFTKRGHNRKD